MKNPWFVFFCAKMSNETIATWCGKALDYPGEGAGGYNEFTSKRFSIFRHAERMKRCLA